eukprot:CAMPEP_0206471386 /NCGR_PEP_ID=MMETSP0324_2-20121206/31530_1 /ASSEMBLY_ACC=CAM_ASM_000836 /TAXON_ID=2866 /ORGANISM="Crypthecodinium cohnii, Strain Seligo" /LENGTH=64 /DNA_ID=CAMNT_0053945697 /DNA_START=99 /DNA_END=291 /DNA_ORIENTATION=-
MTRTRTEELEDLEEKLPIEMLDSSNNNSNTNTRDRVGGKFPNDNSNNNNFCSGDEGVEDSPQVR